MGHHKEVVGRKEQHGLNSLPPLPLPLPLPLPRFVVVCGDGEYIIYTAMALRNKSFGSAQEFVWAGDSNEYAVRENSSTIKTFKNFKETKSFKPDLGAEGEDACMHTHSDL